MIVLYHGCANLAISMRADELAKETLSKRNWRSQQKSK